MDFKLLVVLCCVWSGALAAPEMVVNMGTHFNALMNALRQHGQLYYNPMNGEPLMGEIEETGRFPFIPKIGFRGLPCTCVDMTCGCCAGINVTSIDFNRRYCTNFTFDPTTLAIDMKVLLNGDEIFRSSVSASNPPPVCVPLPYVPMVNFCLRFFDLSVQDRTLHTCIDFETRVALSPLLIMHFNCVKLGNNGVSWVKPGDNKPAVTMAPVLCGKPEESVDNVFDEVEFETTTVSDGIALTDATTLSPEDEDKIGSHRHTKFLSGIWDFFKG